MPMFELTEPIKTKLINYTTLSKKNRPADEHAGVRLRVQQTWPNAFLDYFDPTLRPLLYSKAKGRQAAQATLDGVEAASDMPSLTDAGVKIEALPWHHEMTGYTVRIARGAGMSKAGQVTLNDATLYGWNLKLKDGGSITATYYVEAGSVPPGGAWDCFAELKSREFDMLAKAPEVVQGSLDTGPELGAGEKPPKVAPGRKPGAAERAAVAKVKGGKAEAPKGKHRAPVKTEAVPRGTLKDADQRQAKKTGVEQSQPGTRTARGLDKTKAAIDKGLRDAAADGQQKPPATLQ